MQVADIFPRGENLSLVMVMVLVTCYPIKKSTVRFMCTQKNRRTMDACMLEPKRMYTHKRTEAMLTSDVVCEDQISYSLSQL